MARWNIHKTDTLSAITAFLGEDDIGKAESQIEWHLKIQNKIIENTGARATQKQKGIMRWLCGALSEAKWVSIGKPTYFVESKELCEKLYQIDLDVTANEISGMMGDVCFSFPDGLCIDGFRLVECLWTVRKAPEKTQVFIEFTRDDVHSYFCFSGDESIKQALSGGDEFSDAPEGHKINQESTDVYARICIALIMYSQIYPECVREGFPSVKDREKRHIINSGIARRCVITTAPCMRGPVSPHYRNHHFRVLRDSRFYRQSNGVPVDGKYRVIHVKGSIVKRDTIKAHTVEPGGEATK